MSTSTRRPRLGLFAPRFALFDAAMPDDYPAQRRRYSASCVELLAGIGDVDHHGVVESPEDAERLAEVWRSAPIDIVVCWPTMAAPPAWLETITTARPDCPVLVVVAQEHDAVPDAYTTDLATARSLPVGAVMATNVLRRASTPFEVVVGRLGDDALVADISGAIDVLMSVRAVRTLRLGTVGEPIPGYSDVAVDDVQLARLGVELIDVADDLERAFVDSTIASAEEVVAEVAASWHIDVGAEVLQRSARLAVALEQVVARHALHGGAVNCHGPRLRFNDTIGIAACLAVSRCTAAGTPFACTGDVPTAVALVIGQHLTGSALYCELYQLDLAEDWILVANGGEGDWTYRDEARSAALLPEDHYSGEHGAAVASSFSVRLGAATLMSLSPGIGRDGRWGLVVAEGAVIGSRHDGMEGPNAMFRFDGVHVADGYRQWCRRGATHHAALVPGRARARVERVAAHLDIDLFVVTPSLDGGRS